MLLRRRHPQLPFAAASVEQLEIWYRNAVAEGPQCIRVTIRCNSEQ